MAQIRHGPYISDTSEIQLGANTHTSRWEHKTGTYMYIAKNKI